MNYGRYSLNASGVYGGWTVTIRNAWENAGDGLNTQTVIFTGAYAERRAIEYINLMEAIDKMEASIAGPPKRQRSERD